jgi:hypothetical protein
MRKVIIGVTSIILCLSIGLCGYVYIQYDSFTNKGEKNIEKLKEKINNTDKEINKKKEEVEKIKNDNKEKVELLEVWEKELGKVKKDS